MKKSFIIASTLLIVSMIAVSAFAWGPGRGMGNSQDCPQYNNQEGLTQEQKDELKTLRQQFIDQTYDIRSAKSEKHEQLRLLMETSAPDKENLSALSQEIADLQKQLRDKRIDFALEAKKIAPEFKFSQGRGKWGNRGRHHNRNGNGCDRYNN